MTWKMTPILFAMVGDLCGALPFPVVPFMGPLGGARVGCHRTANTS